ncbi:hypothetical protein V7127_00225 [Bacillus sp. JJ1773]|uniref:hypothetical protein n=1 Tax=Bacillus sp. JJ1773 TaxID=3122965 RepID=UPI003000CCBE
MGLRPTCYGIALGVNNNPLPSLPSDGTQELLSTVTITVKSPDGFVRLMPSIRSGTAESEERCLFPYT